MERKDKGIYVLVTALYDRLNVFQAAIQSALKAGLSHDPNEEIGLYERKDLLRMYRLAYAIGSQKTCCWSDAKPDQFLRRSAGDLIVAAISDSLAKSGQTPSTLRHRDGFPMRNPRRFLAHVPQWTS